MNSNVDVIKELAVKNKEIYLNKLNIDLDNNKENLLITIENTISLFNEEVTNKVLEIENNTLLSYVASKEVLAFHKIIHEELKKLIENRASLLRDKIKSIEKINYKDVLTGETGVLIDNIKKCYRENVDSLIDKLTKESNVFTIERMKDYLKILNYNKFINKIKEAFTNMDFILYNNYLESEKKYNELNKKVNI